MCRRFVKKFLWIILVFAITINTHAAGTAKSINDGYYSFSVIMDLPSLPLEQLKASVLEESYNISKIYLQYYANNTYKQLSIIFNANGKRFMGTIVLPSLLKEVANGLDRETFYKKIAESGMIVSYDQVTITH